jgi:hypothetical protein
MALGPWRLTAHDTGLLHKGNGLAKNDEGGAGDVVDARNL